MDPEVPGSSPGGGTISPNRPSGSGHPLNGHARFASQAAAARGWKFAPLDGPDAYVFEVRDGDRRCVIAAGSASPYALNSAAAMSLARDKGFAGLALTAAGVATIPGQLFFVSPRHAAFRTAGQEPGDALVASAKFRYPVFCKPVSGSRGDFAEIIADPTAFAGYVERVGARHDAILVQPFVRGVEHRVIVLNGKGLCAYEKSPLTVTGDGVTSLAALVSKARAEGKPTTATIAPSEATSGEDRAGQRVHASEVPVAGGQVRILGPQNRSAGGDARVLQAPAPPALAAIGEAAAAALGLAFAGVDVFDVSEHADLSGLLVIEANASPALLTLEAHGRLDLIDAIWGANLQAALG